MAGGLKPNCHNKELQVPKTSWEYRLKEGLPGMVSAPGTAKKRRAARSVNSPARIVEPLTVENHSPKQETKAA